MNLGVVVVTYNRLEKLKKSLSAYEQQTFQPAIILVINNASTDGTKEYLDQWVNVDTFTGTLRKIIHCETNTGGAGGFTTGIQHILTMNVDWVWLADDDAYPEKDCLRLISDYYSSLPFVEQEKINSLCAKVVGNNGNVSCLHRRQIIKNALQIKEVPIRETDFVLPATAIDLFSFVGVAIKTSAIEQVGLPHSDYFIFFDDSEYALRLREQGTIICIPDAVIIHDSPENEIQKYSWKNYYMFRNKLYTYCQYFSKRYVLIEFCKTFYMILRYYNCPASWLQFVRAVYNIHHNCLGKDNRYLPQAK